MQRKSILPSKIAELENDHLNNPKIIRYINKRNSNIMKTISNNQNISQNNQNNNNNNNNINIEERCTTTIKPEVEPNNPFNVINSNNNNNMNVNTVNYIQHTEEGMLNLSK